MFLMATTVSEKLKIKAGYILRTLNEPAAFRSGLMNLPPGVKIVNTGNPYHQLHWFVTNQAQLEKQMSKVMKLLKPGVLVWVYFPKGSSRMQTDLSRDKGWDCLMAEKDKLTRIGLISFDETWSVFGFRAKTKADKRKEANRKPEREILKWVNPKTKEVKLPDDLAEYFVKNKKLAAFFLSLSFTNKKEYIDWIVTAKKPETRAKRLSETIARLSKGWKNPRNI